METTTNEIAEVDEKGREISKYCLGLPTIVRQILGHFSTKKLIELSVMNKLWNFEARSVMRERANVTAKISHGKFKDEGQLQGLPQFASDLANMAVIPFSGIHLDISHQWFDPCLISNGPLDSSLLDLIAWKHFSVGYSRSSFCKNCPALVLVKQIFEDYSGLLEDLTLEFENVSILGPILQGRSFPRLKSLTVYVQTTYYVSRYNPNTSNFVKELVTRAPNLEELGVGAIDLTVNVLEGSSAELLLKYEFHPLTQPICQELVGSIRVEEMYICIDRTVTNPGLLNGFIPMLLNRSRSTLKTLHVDLFSAVPLMSYGIRLENVTKLKLHVNVHSLGAIEPSILALAKGFDFTCVFPRLKKILIFDHNSDHSEFSFALVSPFVQQANAVMSRASLERAINSKVMYLLLRRTIEDPALSFLAQMFPDVKTVRSSNLDKVPSFTDLRKHFLCLEKVIDTLDGIQD